MEKLEVEEEEEEEEEEEVEVTAVKADDNEISRYAKTYPETRE